jgi:glycosyltransferase involved in cell wall biosynthesis
MLARRPVIASDAGGAREVISHRATGWLVPPGDPATLAATIGEVRAMSGEGREAIVTRARADAEQRFSLEAMVAGVARVVEEVVSARRGRS